MRNVNNNLKKNCHICIKKSELSLVLNESICQKFMILVKVIIINHGQEAEILSSYSKLEGRFLRKVCLVDKFNRKQNNS